MTTVVWRPPPAPAVPRTVELTPRQADVLAGICLGLTNQQIARRLYITDNSVKSTTKRVYRHLGARDRAHAAVLACAGHVVIHVNEGRSRS